MDSRLEAGSASLHAANPQQLNKAPEGAGEIDMSRTGEVKQDGDHPVCFELMGMGDLEVVDVVDLANHQGLSARTPMRTLAAGAVKTSMPCSAWGSGSPERPATETPFMSFCSADWAPSEDSSDDDDDPAGLEDVLKARVHECYVGDEEGDGRAALASTVRSKLSVAKVVQVDILPERGDSPHGRQVHAQVHDVDAFVHLGGDLVDVEGDEDDDDESRGAPTPDNTPQHSPSEEHQPGGLVLGLESGAALYSTLKGMAMSSKARSRDLEEASGTPSPEESPGAMALDTALDTSVASTSTGSGGSTLGRVWSIILGRAGRRQGSPPVPPRHSDSEDDSGDDDDALYVDPQTIEELEATLEEVRLDGDADDPVVSYLVEEAEDMARAPGAASRDVTVEEVQEDDGVEHRDDEDDLEHEGAESRTAPAAKASGLLSRIFSRSKTSQDITKAETEQAVRRPERGTAPKRAGKGDVANSDRLLHLHRNKPRQTNKAATRSSLSRILGRWLRQGRAGAWGVGAEGDTGAVGTMTTMTLKPGIASSTVSASRRSNLLQQPPALQSTRRAASPTLDDPFVLHLDDKVLQAVGARLSADFGSQTDESLL